MNLLQAVSLSTARAVADDDQSNILLEFSKSKRARESICSARSEDHINHWSSSTVNGIEDVDRVCSNRTGSRCFKLKRRVCMVRGVGEASVEPRIQRCSGARTG